MVTTIFLFVKKEPKDSNEIKNGLLHDIGFVLNRIFQIVANEVVKNVTWLLNDFYWLTC